MTTRKILVGLILFCVAVSLVGEPCWGGDGEKHFLWKVRSKTATAYLFGSVHVAKPDIYPLSPVIEESFAGSAVLAV